MPEDVARAIGAGLAEGVVIAGKPCKLRPLTLRELTEIERECLSRQRREYLRTYSEGMEFLPEADRGKIMKEKMDEVAKWDLSSLPTKYAYDAKKLKLTESLRGWLAAEMDFEPDPKWSKEELDTRLKNLTATALDQGALSDSTYESLTGEVPKKARVGYVNWWVTATYDGMVSMIAACFRDSGLTRDQLMDEIQNNPNLMIQLAREIENLSAPAMGNG